LKISLVLQQGKLIIYRSCYQLSQTYVTRIVFSAITAAQISHQF